MQKGSLIRRARHSQSEVWEFRWREPGPTGRRRHRRIVVGSVDEIADESAHEAITAAMKQWPCDGIPANPHAWLISTGRNAPRRVMELVERRGQLAAAG